MQKKVQEKQPTRREKGFGFMALSESHDYNLSLELNKDVLLLRRSGMQKWRNDNGGFKRV